MQALHGIGVLVTRPLPQAISLCHLLESFGATAHRLPAIDIIPVAVTPELALRLGAIEAFDLIIFTSANAVRFAGALLGPARDLPLAAIGPATARALEQAGHRVTVTPADGFDSERLLQHPKLAQTAGQRILIVKGIEGRELLQTELTRRGADVQVAAVYRREPSEPNVAELAALSATVVADGIQVITATSADIAAGLLRLATPVLRREFDRLHWVVPGARVAAALRERGVRAPILQADSAEDQDLVAAIIRWRASVSGA